MILLASNVQVDISSPVAYVMSVREDQEVNHVKVHCFSLLVTIKIIGIVIK